MWIFPFIVEVVVPLRIRAQRWIVRLRRQRERRPAAPAAHELRGHELLLLRCLAVLAEEITELAHVLFQAAVGHVTAVAGEDIRVGLCRNDSIFVGIAEYELSRLEGSSRAWRRHIAGPLDHRLGKPVAVAEVIVCIVKRWRGFKVE